MKHRLDYSRSTFTLLRVASLMLIVSASVHAVNYTNTVSSGGTIASGDSAIVTNPMTSINGNITNNGSIQFRQSGTLTDPYAISGTGALYQDGSGTTILGPSNTYTAGTTINAGVLSVSSIADGTASGIGAGSGSTGWVGFYGGTLQYTGLGSQTTTRSLWIDGINGGRSGGTFDISNAGANLTWNPGSGSIIYGVTKTGAGTFTLGGVMSGTSSLAVNGGTMSLTGSGNSYSGGTIVSQGTLRGNVSSSFGSGTIVMGDSGTGTNNISLVMDTSAGSTVANAISVSASGTGSVAIGGTNTGSEVANVWSGQMNLGRNVQLFANNTTTRSSFSGQITGNGGITVTQGRVTIDNSSNNYGGATVVNSGSVLQINGNEVIPNASSLSLNGTLYFASGGGTETVSALDGWGTAQAHPGVPGNYTLNVSGSNSTIFSGVIANGAGVLGLSKGGSSTLTLAGANSYSGTTTISGGVLQVGNAGTTGTLGSGGVVNNASLVVNRSDLITVANAISGSGSVTQAGTGTTVLSSGNSYSGGTIVSRGTLRGNGSSSFGSGTIVMGDASTGTNNIFLVMDNSGFTSITNAITVANFGSGLFSIGGTNTGFSSANSWAGTLTLNRNVQVFGDTSAGGRTSLDGQITGVGGITITSGRVTLGNTNNNFTGPIIVNNGATLQLDVLTGRNELIPNAAAVTVNGFLNFASGGGVETIGSLSGSGTVSSAVSGNFGLVVGNSNSTTFSGVINNGSGVLSLTKNGTGTLALTGANAYTGTTTVSAGTLQVGNGGTSGTIGSGNVTNNATLAFNRSDAITFGNTIGGTGNVIKAGTGTTLLTASNNYSGGTTIRQGTLKGNNSSAFGTGTIVLGDASTGTNNISLVMDTSGGTTVANAISVSASGAGSVAIGGTNTGNELANVWSGQMTLNTNAQLFANNTTTRSSFTGKITGEGGLTVTQGRVTLDNINNDYAGATIVNSGTILQINDNEVLPNSTALTVNGNLNLNTPGGAESVAQLSGSGTIQSIWGANTLAVTGSSNSTFGGVIQNGSGTMAVSKSGSGTLTLNGNNTYTGATTVSEGRLMLNGRSASSSFGIASNGVLEFNVASGTRDSANTAFAGAGVLQKTGDGILKWGLTSANFALSAGSLIDVQGGTMMGGSDANETWTSNQSSLNVASGATFAGVEANVRVDALTGAGTITSGFNGSGYSNFTFGVAGGSGTFTGTLANSDASNVGNFVKVGSGTQVLTGSNTYTGLTKVSSGTLAVNGSIAGDLQVDAGATLKGSGTITGAATISGTHSVGNSPGIQTFGSSLSYGGTSTVLLEFSQNNTLGRGISFDGIDVAGDLSFDPGSVISLSFNSIGSSVNWNDLNWNDYIKTTDGWLLYRVDGLVSGLENVTISGSLLDSNGLALNSARPNSYFNLYQSGNNVYLNYAVPEPSTYALMGLGALALLIAVRRCRA
jgi:autotransporter-associated beta strand protein